MNVFTHSSICFAWIFPFFTNVCMIQWKSLSSSVKNLFSFYLLFLSKIYSFLFDWVCCWGRKNTNTCYEIILHERCSVLSGWWVSAVYLVFFTLLFHTESWCVDHNACAMYGAEHCESYDWIDLNCPKLCGHCGKGEFATFQFLNFLIIVVFHKGAFSLQSSQFSLVLPIRPFFLWKFMLANWKTCKWQVPTSWQAKTSVRYYVEENVFTGSDKSGLIE